MSFGTPYPYGTPGGDEVIAAPQLPPVYRVAQGNSVIVFLHVNGRLAERLRENVEDVVRVLGLTGTVIVAIIVREEGVVRDANAGDLDFQDGLTVTQIAPGVVTIEIGANEITTGMLQDALVTAIKMAPNSVETVAIKDANVTTPKIADANITLAKLAPNSVDSSKIVDGSITAIDIAPGTFPEAGLTLLFEDTFNASTARSFNNVFTAAYDNYLIEGQVTHGSAAQSTFLRLRSGGVDSAGVNQYVGAWTIGSNPAGSPTIAAAGAQGTAGEIIRAVASGTPNNYGFWLNLYGPALVKPTPILFMTGGLHSGSAFTSATGLLWQGQSQAFDGFSIFSAAAMSGYIRIYGKKNTP